ncbi:hypothetical protein ABPG77_011054 [Micractinium sp. CCAP 211/92]
MAAPSAVPAPAASLHSPPRPVQRRQRHGCRRRREGNLPRAFMGSLDLVPGWLVPSWMAPEPSGPRDEVRQQRVRTLRRLLKASGQAPALPLPPLPGEDGGGPPADDAGAAAAGALDITQSASNAVPFTAGGGAAPSSLTVALNGGASSVCRAEEVRTVLPWLFAAEGRLDFSAMEHLASQLALSGLQLLDVGRFASAASSSNGHWHSSWGSHVRWAGPTALPSPAVAAAAALRRMEVRRGGALRGLPEMEGKAVVLTFNPQHRQLAAETLAIYLHAYLGLSGREAVEAAGQAMGTSPLECTLRRSLEELATLADGWFRRVTLAWPYAGGHVEVVGDAVGGWEQRAPMVFNVRKKRWQLQIWGLPPGIHRFKYLVDGCWVIDLAGHTEADARGNINNITMVSPQGKPLLRGRCADGGSGDDSDGGGSEDGDPRGTHGRRAASSKRAGYQHTGREGTAVMAQPAVLATAEPPAAATAAAAAAAAAAPADRKQAQAEQPRALWADDEEMQAMARFGAAVLAFHTRLGVQLRHKLH